MLLLKKYFKEFIYFFDVIIYNENKITLNRKEVLHDENY